MRTITTTILAGALIARTGVAQADCPDGVRKATPREVEHFNRVYGELKAATGATDAKPTEQVRPLLERSPPMKQ